MKLTIEIDLDNDAFQGMDGEDELREILNDITTRTPTPFAPTQGDLMLHDSNGNLVGTAKITP